MPRRTHATRLETRTTINITPLMDLTFLLLIVFMITAPMLEYVVDVTPPSLEGEVAEKTPRTLLVTIKQNGEIICHDRQVSLEKLQEIVQRFKQKNPASNVLLRGDKGRSYGEVVRVLRAVRSGGINDVALVTVPPEET